MRVFENVFSALIKMPLYLIPLRQGRRALYKAEINRASEFLFHIFSNYSEFKAEHKRLNLNRKGKGAFIKLFFVFSLVRFVTGMQVAEFFSGWGGANTSLKFKLNAVTIWRKRLYQKTVNPKEFRDTVEDKLSFNKIFSEYLNREWIDSRSSIDSIFEFVSKNKIVICKPVDGYAGSGIFLLREDEVDSCEGIKKIKELKSNRYVIEQVLDSNGFFKQVCPSAVNVLRITTSLRKGEVRCVDSFFRTGRTGVNIWECDGLLWLVNCRTGRVLFGIGHDGKLFTSHPDTKFLLRGVGIPCYEEAVALCKEMHKRVPALGMIGWDILITNENISVIEGNPFPEIHNTDETMWKRMKERIFESGLIFD